MGWCVIAVQLWSIMVGHCPFINSDLPCVGGQCLLIINLCPFINSNFPCVRGQYFLYINICPLLTVTSPVGWPMPPYHKSQSLHESTLLLYKLSLHIVGHHSYMNGQYPFLTEQLISIWKTQKKAHKTGGWQHEKPLLHQILSHAATYMMPMCTRLPPIWGNRPDFKFSTTNIINFAEICHHEYRECLTGWPQIHNFITHHQCVQ